MVDVGRVLNTQFFLIKPSDVSTRLNALAQGVRARHRTLPLSDQLWMAPVQKQKTEGPCVCEDTFDFLNELQEKSRAMRGSLQSRSPIRKKKLP